MTKIERKLRADPRVESVGDERGEGSGIWVYLVDGLCNGEGCCDRGIVGGCVHVVHEFTWTEVERYMRDVRECQCGDCVPLERDS
jgi:hypothetical protein